MMNVITKYFPDLTNTQLYQFGKLRELYEFWNEQINVISRQDIDNLYVRHVLHSLAIAKFIRFNKDSTVFDIGTGGGFPGIPLAIFFPDVKFYLCDSIKRKIKVVTAVVDELQLTNVTVDHARSEQVNKTFDFVVCRAVSKLPKFMANVQKNLKVSANNDSSNGVISLKGGDLTEELQEVDHKYSMVNISDYFDEEFFETKKIVYLPTVNSSQSSENR